MNILQITQQAYRELGLVAPAALVTSADPAVIQFLAIAGRIGRDLVKEFEWQVLVKESLITTLVTTTTGTTALNSAVITGIPSTAGFTTNYGVAGVGVLPFSQIASIDNGTQITMNQVATASGTVTLSFGQVNYPLPADWGRQIPQTEWDRTNRWPLNGPKSSQEWQNFKSGIVYAGPRLRFRIAGGSIQLNPVPSASGRLSFEYVSKGWCVSTAGVGSEFILADTDSPIFDDNLVVAAIKLRWLQSKGLDFGYAMDDYKGTLEKLKSQDKSAPKLSLSQGNGSILMSTANIQDGNFPSG